jgi:hypothetical protein
MLALGSGFFIREDIVATNFHVIEGAATGFAKIVGGKTEYAVRGVVAADVEHDIVLLALKDVKGPPIPLGDAATMKIGDEVYAVGNPLGLEGTFSAGIISGVRTLGSNTILQITAAISPGSSGGPVLNAEGRVIGIATASYRGGQNLNFAVPTSYLPVSYLEERNLRPLQEWSKPSKAKSILSDLGEKNTQGVVPIAIDKFNSTVEFSLKNQLSTSVRHIHYIVTFYDRPAHDRKAEVVDFEDGICDDTIPAKPSKRVTCHGPYNLPKDAMYRKDTAAVRVLDFEIAE